MNSETKRHIDAARQVLVGVVPNPTSQIDQITNALIYKFMDDMDQSAIKSGGEPSFFIGELERYAWTRLMDTRIGNQDRMNLYTEALVKFTESKRLPELFRNIFKSAYLPYRSPEVLGLFLKEIDYFDYSHPEELGNAYEYLLSIMSSQGDAGQFRTPRHIIDFIVEVVNPTKDDKVLDPACGTGGFLVSAYKHILKQHDGKDDPKKKEKTLTPDQRRVLMQNLEGYDIDPGMVRIAQVNMYLHQFKNPKIVQYDSLWMDERWNDKFDVILANPPFMSPRGGIKPHSKFSIQSTRSEVLFVDYIMNHLRPKGRAGIIVPEGIIFQSGTAHKQLRKNLVNDGLYAVVSLPSGVFQPYSGVKTSILFFDNEISKKSNDILFIKINNDGFDLGAQRRPLKTSHLPAALEVLHLYKNHIINGKKIDFQSDDEFTSVVSKEKVAESGDYNLSSDRYKISTEYTNQKYPLVTLDSIIDINFGERITKSKDVGTKYPVYGGGGESFRTDEFNREDEYVISRFAMSENCVRFVNNKFWMLDSGGTFSVKDSAKADKDYIGKVLLSIQKQIYACSRGGAQRNLNVDLFKSIEIPLPPIEIQKEVVEQIEVKQKAIEGAKQVIENLERERRYFGQSLRKLKDIKMIELGELLTLEYGKPLKEEKRNGGIYPVFGSNGIVGYHDQFLVEGPFIIVGRKGTAGAVTYSEKSGYPIDTTFYVNVSNNDVVELKYLYSIMSTLHLDKTNIQAGVPGLNRNDAYKIKIPLPPIDVQRRLIQEVEEQDKIINSNIKLIEIMEKRISDEILNL